jgi:DNA-binding cell septation regulator SpoVG
VKIVRMHKQDFGKIRAFFDLLTGDGFTINGLFVSMPSEKNKDGEYNDTVYCVKEIREKLNQLAINHYNGSDAAIQDHTEINTKDSSDIPF